MAFVAQGEGLRSGEVMKTGRPQRAEFGRELDVFVLEVIILVLEIVSAIFIW
jgi:hypothetical protein